MQALGSVRLQSFSTSLFLKTLLALSGAGWFGFLVGHLFSNLHLLMGREAFNAYYAGLKADPVMLWSIRGVLIAGIVVHVGTAYVLSRRSMEARPGRYAKSAPRASNYASRTMRWTGPIVGLYIVYHLLHLTVGAAMPSGVAYDAHDEYANVVGSFQVWYVALAYIVANAMLTVHLFHGVSSAFQSLGLSGGSLDGVRHTIATTLAIVVCAAFASLPLAVLLGIVS